MCHIILENFPVDFNTITHLFLFILLSEVCKNLSMKLVRFELFHCGEKTLVSHSHGVVSILMLAITGILSLGIGYNNFQQIFKVTLSTASPRCHQPVPRLCAYNFNGHLNSIVSSYSTRMEAQVWNMYPCRQ